MKKYFVIASILFLAAACSKQVDLTSPNQNSKTEKNLVFADTVGWQIYNNAPLGFLLLMPPDWSEVYTDYKERDFVWLKSESTQSQSKARDKCLKTKEVQDCPGYLNPELSVQRAIFRNPDPATEQEKAMYSYYENITIGETRWFKYKFPESSNVFFDAQTPDQNFSISLSFGSQVPEQEQNSVLRSFKLK